MNRTLTGDVQYNDGELGLSQCVWCRHRSAGGHRCRAFSTGIPEAILENRHDHRYPYDGDHGVRFEPEVVEIEFVDVEQVGDSVRLSAELAVAMARVGNDEPDPAVATTSGEVFEPIDLDGVDFDLGNTASG